MSNEAAKIPDWMTIDHDSATIRLRHPRDLSGVKTDRIRMVSPSIKMVRVCRAAHPKDEEAEELMLFSSMSQLPVEDLEKLDIKDYGRLQQGYFRLHTDDGL